MGHLSVDLAASHPHYLAHLLPVWRALPPEIRGDAYLAAPIRASLPGSLPIENLPQTDNAVLVAGFDDLRRVGGHAILMEHGCGQSYRGDPDNRAAAGNPAYAGGDGRHGVLAFLCPNEYAAGPNRETYPDALTVVVGSPRLAHLQTIPAAPAASERPVVAFGFHWPVMLAPESGTGWSHWVAALAKLAASGRYEILGHGHPRAWSDLKAAYTDMGIEPVREFDEVLARAHVYCCDNSSTLFEFAAVRGPVVVLDWPACRPEIEHGLRFWDAADVGPRIIEPAGLSAAVGAALATVPWPGAEERLARVFPAVADPAAAAVAAILEAVGRPRVPRRNVASFPRTTPAPI